MDYLRSMKFMKRKEEADRLRRLREAAKRGPAALQHEEQQEGSSSTTHSKSFSSNASYRMGEVRKPAISLSIGSSSLKSNSDEHVSGRNEVETVLVRYDRRFSETLHPHGRKQFLNFCSLPTNAKPNTDSSDATPPTSPMETLELGDTHTQSDEISDVSKE